MTELNDAININPVIQVWEMYEIDETYRAHVIDWKPWYQAIRDYDCVFDFRGKTAHYIIVTGDRSITRQEALHFAKALHEGKVSRLHIDLTSVSR